MMLLAPGAGAPSSSSWMQAWKQRLGALGEVVTLDYPYQLEGRRSPDPLPKLIAAHRAALRRARDEHGGDIVLIGKSMGGRVGCHVALEERVSRLVCLGYPLKGAGKRAAVRDEVLLALGTPILFVQGTRDALCPLDLLEAVRNKMTAPSELYVVESGDHSLIATRGHLQQTGKTQEDVNSGILEAIRRFLTSNAHV